MKTRLPTREEKRLWREVTARDTKLKPEPDIEEDAPAAPVVRKVTTVSKPLPKKLAKAASTPLAPLDRRAADRAIKARGKVEAVLDLHGHGKLEAYGMVQSFLKAQAKKGHRHLLIVTGKGKGGEGLLQASLPHWLNEPAVRGLVSAFAPARAEKGGRGATHVLLKKPK